LFDKQYVQLQDEEVNFQSIAQRKIALYNAFELYGLFYQSADETKRNFVRERIKIAEGTSDSAVDELIKYFAENNKGVDIDNQINDIRRRWVKIYYAVAPIYITLYWDSSQHNLDDFTLAQKRFDELKGIYVDCFETFCRISVIAAGIEGIITTATACVPKAKGTQTIDQFDTIKNGSKPDILKKLKIADFFVPFIEHRLRNGIGHHTAHYDVVGDKIDYSIENEKGTRNFSISYIAFCRKLVELYGQLELVSYYSNWLQMRTS
jgi:hypothetical protein